MSDSERRHGLQSTRLLHPWDFPGKSTGVGCHLDAKDVYKASPHSHVSIAYENIITE